MKANRFFIIMAMQLMVTSLPAQDYSEIAKGSWLGHLRESSMDLRLIFNVSLSSSGDLTATLDSPDQSVEGLKMGKVTATDTLFLVDGTTMGIMYKGTFTSDTLIKGKWIQAGKEYSVDLVKMKGALAVNRPQEPMPPLPYRSEEVTFTNRAENFPLAGTLTIPDGEGPFPAVILVSGSGYQDRDETVFNHKPFLVLADYLTRNGIAVLRYDDRGTGMSKGNRSNATTLTLSGDALSALEYLMQRQEINPGRIGLAGHSEGSLIAAIVASSSSDVAFVISMAGPGVNGGDILIRQSSDLMRASGRDTSEINRDIKTRRHLFTIMAEQPDQKSFARDAMRWYASFIETAVPDPEKRKEESANFARLVVAVNSPWYRYFILTDPQLYWKKVKCPVLALNGEKDVQVFYADNLKAIGSALKQGGNNKVVIKSMPGLNHLFQHCDKGLTTEYASIEETFSPEAMEVIAEWINKTIKKGR